MGLIKLKSQLPGRNTLGSYTARLTSTGDVVHTDGVAHTEYWGKRRSKRMKGNPSTPGGSESGPGGPGGPGSI